MENTTENTDNCDICRFYVPTSEHSGDCRQSAPVIVRRKTRWPSVPAETLACGDFKQGDNAITVTKNPIDKNIFSARVRNALYHASIVSWEQLQRLGRDELLTIRGIGTIAVEEILDVLDSRGLKPTTPKALASRTMGREAAPPTTQKEVEQAKETAVEEKTEADSANGRRGQWLACPVSNPVEIEVVAENCN